MAKNLVLYIINYLFLKKMLYYLVKNLYDSIEDNYKHLYSV